MKSAQKNFRPALKSSVLALRKWQLPPAILIFQELRRIERLQGMLPSTGRHHVD